MGSYSQNKVNLRRPWGRARLFKKTTQGSPLLKKKKKKKKPGESSHFPMSFRVPAHFRPRNYVHQLHWCNELTSGHLATTCDSSINDGWVSEIYAERTTPNTPPGKNSERGAPASGRSGSGQFASLAAGSTCKSFGYDIPFAST